MMILRSWWARFAILAILLAALLIPRTSFDRGTIWSIVLAAIAATGIGMIRLSGRERADMALVERSDDVVSPRDGERVAVCGVIVAEDEVLESPVRGREAVLYHFSVLHTERFSHGISDGTKDVVDYAGYGAIPARVEGTRFAARLGVFPTLNGFEEKSIATSRARENAGEYLRFAKFETLGKGEIEWVPLMEDMWDGRSRVVRNFRRGEGRPMEQCKFHEASVSPGDRVCAIGTWSAQQNALIAANGQDLWLHRGSKESVREALASSVGCGRVLGLLMIVGSLAAAAYLAFVGSV